MNTRTASSGTELRQRFQRFFEAKGHTWKASDSLVPRHDPTVLFTSAGMNQFKDYLLGQRTDLARAASCQKCLRMGDLDRIVELKGHHTFFEMLGNFSFGDYVKREAIAWAWEFLTGTLDYRGTKPSPLGAQACLRLAPETLWVSVYKDDHEAASIWTEHIGMPAEKIRRMGAEDNFWPSNAPAQGPNGPCGPCSEIYARHAGRDLEIWNLVFTQFDRRDDGALVPLPQSNIDTGMGLERLAQVVQGTRSDYETDLFEPIVRTVRTLVREQPQPHYVCAIADHIRAAVFMIGDGVLPSNESHGYVLRMLIRRSLRYAVKTIGLGIELRTLPGGLLPALVPSVLMSMCGRESPYGSLHDQQRHIDSVLLREEETFLSMLDASTAKALELLAPLKGHTTVVPAEMAFKLYDTFGLPLEVTEDIAREAYMFDGVDHAGFQALLAQQQARSRAGSKYGGVVFTERYEALVSERGGASRFVGYERVEADGKITALFRAQAPVTEATAGEVIDVVLDQTPFYGESGGQVGDTGVLTGPQLRLEVTNAQRAHEATVHTARVTQGVVRVGDTVTASVDGVRRLQIARNHTATHILHSVLRDRLGSHVQQRGSLVAPDRLRFDFTHTAALDTATRAQIELEVNRRIMHDDAVQAEEMSFEQARAHGALAFFGDTYGERVRVMTINGYSKELCGGTHLPRAGAVGPFKFTSESSIAAGVRRVEAVTGERAAQRMQTESATLDALAALLSKSRDHVLASVEQLLARQRQLEKTMHDSKRQASLSQADAVAAKRCEHRGVGLIAETLGNMEPALVRQMADRLRAQLSNTMILLGSSMDAQKASLILALTPDLVQAGYDASQLIQPVAELIDGSGGGRKDLAQAGGKNPGKLQHALTAAPSLLIAQRPS